MIWFGLRKQGTSDYRKEDRDIAWETDLLTPKQCKLGNNWLKAIELQGLPNNSAASHIQGHWHPNEIAEIRVSINASK